ncbi:uncharacterized protein L201_008093 [Kwoniella dendrophila CBS 6074]|uniref:Uncharacterized protein n=1 Tax=Kwoniella dendrophila CBS 6074 TaxID=1295534 RepID=A0AAX4K694_9TREE
MSIETAIHLPFDLCHQNNTENLHDQKPTVIADRIEKTYNDEVNTAYPIECPSPEMKSYQRSYKPDVESNLPSTPSIPILNLPIPSVTLTPHRYTETKSTKISKINTQGKIPIQVDNSAPNSVKDLRSLAGSIGYSSTLKPAFIIDQSPGQSINDHTLKVDRKPSLISLGGQLRNLDKSFIEQYLNSSSSDTVSRRGSSEGDSTVRLVEKSKRGIDEVEIEWCFYCGKEGLRNDLILEEIDLNEIFRIQNNNLKEVNDQLQVNGCRDQRRSWQWSCKDKCERPQLEAK